MTHPCQGEGLLRAVSHLKTWGPRLSPSDTVDKEAMDANVGDIVLDPCPGMIPQGPRAAKLGVPHLLKPSQSLSPSAREATAMRSPATKSSPLWPSQSRESSRAATKTQCTKNKPIVIYKYAKKRSWCQGPTTPAELVSRATTCTGPPKPVAADSQFYFDMRSFKWKSIQKVGL